MGSEEFGCQGGKRLISSVHFAILTCDRKSCSAHRPAPCWAFAFTGMAGSRTPEARIGSPVRPTPHPKRFRPAAQSWPCLRQLFSRQSFQLFAGLSGDLCRAQASSTVPKKRRSACRTCWSSSCGLGFSRVIPLAYKTRNHGFLAWQETKKPAENRGSLFGEGK